MLPHLKSKFRLAWLSHQKKSSPSELRLTGVAAISHTSLNPEGTVLVKGELWRARSVDGRTIAGGARVQVVGAEHHLLLVTAN